MRPVTHHCFSAWCQAIQLSEQLFTITGGFNDIGLANTLESAALRLTQTLGDSCSSGEKIDDVVTATVETQRVSLKVELEIAMRHAEISPAALNRFMGQINKIGNELSLPPLQLSEPTPLSPEHHLSANSQQR